MISPLPGRHHAEARAARRSRCPASAPTSSTTTATRSAIPGGGYLVLTRPWPSMLRGIWGDPERYRDTYWIAVRRPLLRRRRRQARRRRLLLAARPGRRRHARRRATTSRPPRSSTRSSAHPAVAEAAVVGTQGRRPPVRPISAFVILRAGNEPSDDARRRAARPRRRSTSARSPSRRRSCSPRTCRRPGRARSCAGSCATSPRTRRSATPPRSPTRRVVEGIKARYLAGADADEDDVTSRPGASYVPEHWTWHDGPVEPGPAVVVDIDGVLSDAASRQHYLEAPRRDWDAFFEACGDDPVIEEMKVLLDLLDPELRDRAAHRPARSGCTTSPRRGCAATRSGGTCCSCGRGATTTWPATSSRRRCGTCATTASSCASPSRTTAATSTMFRSEGVPCIYFHSGYYD